MKRLLFLLLLLAPAFSSSAVNRDSLFVANLESWVMHHRVSPGESIYSVARRYSVPVEILAKANGLKPEDQIDRIVTLIVPLGEYNLLTAAPGRMEMARPLFYRATISDNLYRISNLAGVTKETLAMWNEPLLADMRAGRVLLVGWVRYDPTVIQTGPASVVRPLEQPRPDDTAEVIFLPDISEPSKADIPPTLEQEWNEQTVGGLNVVTEKGTVGFFNISGKAKGAAIYAFHNAAARGTVMKVRNTNNGRTIFVKVLGPLPDTKQYAGCVLGLSDGAKAALGVRENKAFCEMSYAGY